MNRSRFWRVLRWGALASLLVGGVAVANGCVAFGKQATGARKARMTRSPQWQDGHFENPQPIVNHVWPTITGMFNISDHATPVEPPPAVTIDPRHFETPPASGLRITWMGHASTLIEIDGERILTDPMWSERAGPFSWIGPTRYYPPPIALEALPHIDAVVISHDHYDHLDMGTIVAMKDWDTKFFVPLGIGAHLEYWGVAKEKIVELDWWESRSVGDVEIVCTPARHASGRVLIDNYATLWSSWSLIGSKHRVFFSGDTGLFPGMAHIGERYGPFDVTLLETGQYHAGWPDWHMGPEQAVIAHQMLKGKKMFPIHWGLLTLAFHGWTEPIERVLAYAGPRQVPVIDPRPGQSVEPDNVSQFVPWWPKLAFETAEQAPVISSGVPLPSEHQAPIPALLTP
ncbi:MAG: MBL fold metallo-hydrolase [Deltaproteobacteria bacterium]|nr:MBL fold metallo-hydrolase [Deltaproteobacteria bacterium]